MALLLLGFCTIQSRNEPIKVFFNTFVNQTYRCIHEGYEKKTKVEMYM